MPRIAGVATATPPHEVSQAKIKEFAQSFFGDPEVFASLNPLFDEDQVAQRYFTVNLEWFSSRHSFVETNEVYIQSALTLSEKVTVELASQCGIETEDFDLVFFVSTTGLATPSIDARLFNRIKLNSHIKRVPIWGLGCAGGSAAISRAFDYLGAYPKHRVLIIAVELCGLGFEMNPFNKSEIYSSALFGEGAAACAVFGDQVPSAGRALTHTHILDTLSTLYPDSLDAMSWRVTSQGFRIELSERVPEIISGSVKSEIHAFLESNHLTIQSLKHFVLHPGGQKVLQAYAKRLGVAIEKLNPSSSILKEFGNMSSVTVFFILKRVLEQESHLAGEYGLMGAVGPGFSSEFLLLQW
jgi:alkylresorcinol/alkylpyrone synthase